MRTYEQAVAHYDRCTAPKRSKKWAKFTDNPRYLRNVGATHLGIHKEDVTGVIYYRLYDTDVARFYPPLADGSRKVEMNYYDSQMTNIFMYDYGLHYYDQVTTEGKFVKVPYVSSYDGKGVSATLWFTAEGKLIVDKSQHRDIYTFKSDADDRQKRKDFKAKLETLTTLAMLRLDDYKANAELKGDYGQPFGTQYSEPHSISDFRRTIRDLGANNTEDPRYIQDFLEFGQGVFSVLASKRAYAYVPEGSRWEGELFQTWSRTPEQIANYNAKKIEIAHAVTAEEFKKSLTTRMLELASIKRGSVKTPWGQFRDSIPRKFYT